MEKYAAIIAAVAATIKTVYEVAPIIGTAVQNAKVFIKAIVADLVSKEIISPEDQGAVEAAVEAQYERLMRPLPPIDDQDI